MGLPSRPLQRHNSRTRKLHVMWCIRWCIRYGFILLLLTPTSLQDSFSPDQPCTYEDHLITRPSVSWFGFLANITMHSTGRLSFHFVYPIQKCCQNVLFYTDDQVASLSPVMNCWQKEYIISPQQEQIIRLTPTFTWSGCHPIYPSGVPHYECVGGRSFTTGPSELSTWYIAVSDCASLYGLDLKYQIKVYGQVGECQPGYRSLTTRIPGTASPSIVEQVKAKPEPETEKTCIIEGNLNTSVPWYGFIANLTLEAGGGFEFHFNFPFRMHKQNVILYSQEDAEQLEDDYPCFQKEAVIRSRNIPDQILELGPEASWNGCLARNSSRGRNITCQGERRFNVARRILMAVSNCWGKGGLVLNYRLVVSGYQRDSCSGAQSITLRTPGSMLLVICSVWVSVAVVLSKHTSYTRIASQGNHKRS